jgi:hypothetical protein
MKMESKSVAFGLLGFELEHIGRVVAIFQAMDRGGTGRDGREACFGSGLLGRVS